MCYRVFVFMPILDRYLPQSNLMPMFDAHALAASVRAAYPHMSVITLPY